LDDKSISGSSFRSTTVHIENNSTKQEQNLKLTGSSLDKLNNADIVIKHSFFSKLDQQKK